MKKITQNNFGKGLNMDLNPLSTPKDVLTDCLNGTIITYNGDEFNLQTELGNVKVKTTGTEDALPQGFIPLGVKEFDGIMYIVAHNPFTKETSVGSLPSPQRYITIADGDNKSLKSISDISAETSQGGIELMQSDSINHGMNLLNAFISPGDKFKIAITLIGVDTWNDSNQIFSKFINNYGTGSEGYFDFKYYTMNTDGGLTSIPLNLLPNYSEDYSTVSYSPEPTGITGENNGKDIVYNGDSKGVITVVMSPSTIQSFDFGLVGDNTGGILKAKVTFTSDNIVSNSAIRVKTIEIKTISSNGETVANKFFDYQTYIGNSDVMISKLTSGEVPVSFEVGTVLTITCTPIDQFGRRLTQFAKTKYYVISDLPLGLNAHDNFVYDVTGDILTVTFNYLYKGQTSMPTVNVEFYDFWSNVSLLKENIPLIDQKATITVPLATFNRDTIFNGSFKGGLATSDIDNYTGSVELISPNKIMHGAALRKDHCYLVRIFGVESGISYNIFQLLYTLPIAKFKNSNMRNYGMIDIVKGMEILDKYDLNYTGTGILDKTLTPIQPSGTITIGDNHPNYLPITGHPSPSLTEAYRLYGGPVFCEASVLGSTIKRSDWTGVKKYYRNAYTGEFYDISEDNLKNIGYHTFSEISTKLGITGGDISMSSDYFSLNKKYLTTSLSTAIDGAKDFKFAIFSDCTLTVPSQTGTIKILPISSSNKPLLFGEIDNTLFKKKLTLKSTEHTSATNEFSHIMNFTSDQVTSQYTWLSGNPNSDISTNAALQADLTSTSALDTFTISNIALSSQRPTIAPSLFKSYTRSYARNKTFKYFSWTHSQVVKSTRVSIENTGDLSSYSSFDLMGTDDVDFSLSLFTPLSGTPLEHFQFLTYLWGNLKLEWELLEPGNNQIILTTIRDIGGVIPNIDDGTLGTFNSALGDNHLNSSRFVIGCNYSSPGNTIPQTIHQSYKTDIPVNVEIKYNDAVSLLTTYNNLWFSGDYPLHHQDVIDNKYIGFKQTNTYLTDLLVNQKYSEVILAQYADKDLINYVTSGVNTLALVGNSITYTLLDQSVDRTLKYITKSCFGSSTLSPFNINNVKLIIDNWKGVYPLAKILYNFVDSSMFPDGAKNIPWNFSSKESCKPLINPINIVLSASTPTGVRDTFTNALTTMESSSYLVSSTGVTPSVKVIYDNSITTASSEFVNLTDSLAISNINNSDLKIPRFSPALLGGRLTTIDTPVYGIDTFCLNPPSIKDIRDGVTYTIGMLFGGGVIFYILQLGDIGFDTNVQHGLIASLKDQSPNVWGLKSDYDPLTVGASGSAIGTGKTNSALMSLSSSKGHAIQTINNYVIDNYSDWYLPSLNEMLQMYAHRNVLGYPTNVYWSSTESGWDKAYVVNLNDGGNGTYLKNNTYHLRAIRSF